MHAVTITQITPQELQTLIDNSVSKFFSVYSTPPQRETDTWFDLTELCNYLPDRPAKATVYGQVSANTIPYHKGAKKLRFLKSEIDAWLKQGRNKTISEIETEVENFLGDRKKHN